MKSNKKFPPALGAIVEQALKDNTAWIGKTVLELTCEAIKKHGLSQEEMSIVSTQCENVSKKDKKIITLTVEEASRCHDCCCIAYQFVVDEAKPKYDELIDKLEKFVLDEMAKQAETK